MRVSGLGGIGDAPAGSTPPAATRGKQDEAFRIVAAGQLPTPSISGIPNPHTGPQPVRNQLRSRR